MKAHETADRVAELMAALIGEAILFNEQVARSIGISAVDLQTFGVISRAEGPLTPGEVATRTGLPPSTTTRVLDRLEDRGYIARNPVPGDRRKLAVHVVPEKAAEIAQRYAGKIDAIRSLNRTRTEAELAAVVAYLGELVENREPAPLPRHERRADQR